MWVPGETFQSGSGIIVHVESMDDERAVVSLSNQARNPVCVSLYNSGYQDGTSEEPWDTVEEGYASVYPQGTVFIMTGSYDETLSLSKACTLVRWGTSGTVTIGK
jgi:hypothetical protein